jgi:hypothetical protein
MEAERERTLSTMPASSLYAGRRIEIGGVSGEENASSVGAYTR